MANIQKEEKVRSIVEDIKAASAVWVIDYRGLTVKESEQLRVAVRESGAQMKILKNTLTIRALDELGLPTMEDTLAGPSAFIFAEGDPVTSAKAIKNFAQDNKKVVVKGGIMDGVAYSAEQVAAIADLPSREQLLSMLLQTLLGPATGMVRVLNGPMESFARVLGAISENAA